MQSAQARSDTGYIIQSDFEAIQSAWLCLQSIYLESNLKFQVEVNNLGDRDTLSKYNKALAEVLMPKRKEFSAVS